jgi:heme-degrading monooxygenase HmoA
MYVTIRRYADRGGLLERLVLPVRDCLVPLLRKAQGFKGYCVFASEDGHIASVSIFDRRDAAVRANEQVREWVVAHLKDLLPDPPEVMAGEALLHKEAHIQSGGPDMFVTVRIYEGVGSKEEVLPRVREHAFPVITGTPGFRGYYTFLDERDSSRGVSVSLYDTRQHAVEANEQVMAVMRDKRIAPNPPSIMAGQVAVVTAAEH